MEKLETLDLFEESEKFIKGMLVAMIYHNEENFYSVAKIKVIETNENYDKTQATVTGYFPRIHEDETYTFYGQFVEHPRFGKQYQVDHYRKELPQTKDGIISYLSSKMFKGIGEKTATAIVDALGTRAISKIIEDKEVLQQIPKLSKEKAEALYETLIQHQGLEQIMITLSQYGFGPQLSTKIYQKYLDQTLDIIQNNPYQLVRDIEGIGFTRADELGQMVGISGKHPARIQAGCLYILNQETNQEGHVYLDKDELLAKAHKLLQTRNNDEITVEDIEQELQTLINNRHIIAEEERIYLPSLYFSEKGLVNNIKRIMAKEIEPFPDAEFYKALGELEENLNVEYAPSQREAIQKALISPMMILTGGPGTGKTTVIKGIVNIYAKLHGLSLDPSDYKKKEETFPILLVAPTGRAAKRMSETTDLPAMTIHRLLGWSGENFSHDEDNPIEGSLIIVDEVSMVDIWLAHQLLQSLPSNIQVVFVGDEDQLPSVGPGQVLKDLIEAEIIPTVKLVDIYRQAEGSTIVELAHHIKDGIFPDDLRKATKDRSFFPCKQEQVLDIVRQVCESAVKKGYSPKDIQVLAPMYKGAAGIDVLNRALQQLFNPMSEQKRQLKYGDVIFRVGDKVLQLVNQPEDNVFNGDMGEIAQIFYAKENVEKEDQVVVSFDGTEVVYTKADLGKITHAYCCSIHKSQGSEFPIVILPIVKGYYRMLRRKLLYTAVTRSKRFLIICGEEEAIRIAVTRSDESLRKSTLKDRLLAAYDKQAQEEIDFFEMEVDEAQMANVSPYDFMD